MEQSDFGANVAGRAINSATVATASLDALADELHYACQNFRRTRGVPSDAGIARGGFVLSKLSELPDSTADQNAAEARVRTLGRRLFDHGGDRRMIDVYDRAVEKYEHSGVFGANALWDGIGAWTA